MNIMYTSECPVQAAKNLCKVHLNSQYKEACQMLSTTLHLTTDNLPEGLCKIAHPNHPSTKWVRSSIDHYNWLVAHAKAIRELIGKPHGNDKYLEVILSVSPNLPSLGFSEPPKVFDLKEHPEMVKYQVFSNTVDSYKKYLKVKYNSWTTRTHKRRMKVEFVNNTPDHMLENW